MIRMNEQSRNRHPDFDTFRGSSVLGPLILIGAGVFVLIVSRSGPLSFLGVWVIGFGVFRWFWSTRFAWWKWWNRRVRGRNSPEVLTEGDLQERRVRLALFHPYVFAHQTFFILFLMYWAAEYPAFLSYHHGVWFCLSVIVLWGLLSLFFRYIGRGDMNDFDYVHGFDKVRGRFNAEEGT